MFTNYNQQQNPQTQTQYGQVQPQTFNNYQQQGFAPQTTSQLLKQQQKQLHMNNLTQTLGKIYQLQNQPQLNYLIQIMQAQQKIQIDTLQKTMNQGGITSMSANDMDSVLQRSKKIKQKNIKLLEKLLLIKGKLERLMYKDMNQHSRYQNETSLVLDKIRGLKSQMIQKCAYLRTSKISKHEQYEQRQRSQTKNQKNFSTIGTGLKQLKHGTQVLQREVIRQKTQMELVIKHLSQNSY